MPFQPIESRRRKLRRVLCNACRTHRRFTVLFAAETATRLQKWLLSNRGHFLDWTLITASVWRGGWAPFAHRSFFGLGTLKSLVPRDWVCTLQLDASRDIRSIDDGTVRWNGGSALTCSETTRYPELKLPTNGTG